VHTRLQQLEAAHAAGQASSGSLQDMLVLVKDQQMELVQVGAAAAAAAAAAAV
jgi:hypothetical protein